MKVHHAGKMDDLLYALPVVKALAREHGLITLITSALCYQLVPLLWEQPYLADVEMDYARSYRIGDDGSMEPWAILNAAEGINLSPQPAMYRPNAPIRWTSCYMEIAGVKELTANDRIALPTLWNHRQWYWEHTVQRDGGPPWKPPGTAVLAPESETLKTIPLSCWLDVAEALIEDFERVLVIGAKADGAFDHVPNVTDLRGLTTVSSAARLLAEAHVAICANSLPWHLARHAGTPTFCFQDQYIERCVPVDTPWAQYVSEDWRKMVDAALELAHKPRTTLWPDKLLKEIQCASS